MELDGKKARDIKVNYIDIIQNTLRIYDRCAIRKEKAYTSHKG